MPGSASTPLAANRSPVPYDGRDDEVELSTIAPSRAPTYISKNSFWNGEGDDNESLITQHNFTSSAAKDGGSGTAVRVVSQTPTAKSNRERRRKLQGWRFGVACSAWVAFAVLVLNLILTIYGGVGFAVTDGVGTAYEGNCKKVNTSATWLHVLINVLSSILLSASNYTMQCLCSPTRKEIDRAHARGDWLDVGAASVRNIFKIRRYRCALWWILALSSVPIHLLYNSAVFKSLAANEFYVVVGNTDFLKGEPFQMDFDTWYSLYYGNEPDIRKFQQRLGSATENGTTTAKSPIVNLTNSECIAGYGTSFVSEYYNLLAITETQGRVANETLFWGTYSGGDDGGGAGKPWYSWICTESDGLTPLDCNIASVRKNASQWSLGGSKIEYCLAEIAEPHCKLQFSLQILITVIIMNFCKCAVMFVTLYRQRDHTLVTIGDALASFLDNPSELTQGRCLMAKVDVDKGPMRWRLRGTKDKPNTQPLPITYWGPLRRRWFGAASVTRWCVTMGLCVVALVTASALLALGVSATKMYLGDGQTAFSLGFGAIDSRALIDSGLPSSGAGGLVSAVLLANCPQAIFSFLYLAYNGLLTSMVGGHEYSKFGVNVRRKPLRVTTPRGQQRSTYYLQLPYKYSIPLIVVSSTLHWLISESIFLARIAIYSQDDSDQSTDAISEVGYSCLPILLAILLGSAMLSVALGLGFRKFASHIPVAGSCSVAIAAAAHRPKHDVDAAYLPVQWGEVLPERSEEVGHCCFTSEDVHDLTPGRMYAGLAASTVTGSDLGNQLRQRSLNVQ